MLFTWHAHLGHNENALDSLLSLEKNRKQFKPGLTFDSLPSELNIMRYRARIPGDDIPDTIMWNTYPHYSRWLRKHTPQKLVFILQQKCACH